MLTFWYLLFIGVNLALVQQTGEFPQKFKYDHGVLYMVEGSVVAVEVEEFGHVGVDFGAIVVPSNDGVGFGHAVGVGCVVFNNVVVVSAVDEDEVKSLV
jgi:hypothetical protein